MTKPNLKLCQAALSPAACVRASNQRMTLACELDDEFITFICHQRLAGIWLEQLPEELARLGHARLREKLVFECKFWTAQELPQKRAMQQAHEVLLDAGIPYFFAKGVQLRKTIYSNTWHRPACDIDLFVTQTDREKAVASLQEAGFNAFPNSDTNSHELKLSKSGADIDLHWHLLRPGRYRPGVMRWLFQHREKFENDFWGLDATASLFVMLVHPPITKYLLSPTSMLIHQVDQALLIRSGKVDWEELYSAFQASGLKAAAWSSLYVLKELAGIEPPANLLKRVQPGIFKSWYLRQWIDKGWITQWFEHRPVTAFGFNLWLQDSFHDVWRALICKLLGKRIDIERKEKWVNQ